jgi:hypothetical protein
MSQSQLTPTDEAARVADGILAAATWLGEHLATINADDRGVDVSGLGNLRLLRDPVR